MATINLGAIKFNWKGAYNSSTTYAVDDVVSSGGNSYVCIQAHSNQAVGNATAYWNIMSSAGTNGTNGTNGTDVGTVITTQGDMLYRDGSGLARLGYGTAGQVLQTGGSGANPSWADSSGGNWEFIKSVTPTAGASTVQFVHGTGGVTWDSTYVAFKVSGYGTMSNSQYATPALRMLQSGSEVASDYYQTAHHSFGTGYDEGKSSMTWNYLDMSRGGAYGSTGSVAKGGTHWEYIIDNVQNAHNTIMARVCWEQDNNNFTFMHGGCVVKNGNNHNGVSIRTNTNYGSNSITDGNWQARGKVVLCGIKA